MNHARIIPFCPSNIVGHTHSVVVFDGNNKWKAAWFCKSYQEAKESVVEWRKKSKPKRGRAGK